MSNAEKISARPLKGSETSALEVVFEDEHLLVVEKPRAMHCVTHKAEDPTTLADCLAAYNQSLIEATPDTREAGLVQRLDFFTSGLLMAAKTRASWEALREKLFSESVKKDYLALVSGRPKPARQIIDFALAQSKAGKNIKIATKHSKKEFPAKTEIHSEVTSKDSGYSIIRASAARARRHQIRVHMTAIGHPLVGDRQYGSEETLPQNFEGFLLHASTLGFTHPFSKEELLFESVWPYDSVVGDIF